MPGGPRRDVVREGEIAIYHTWTRCALQAHLCGRDPAGVDRSYRRAWMESLLEFLAAQFAIDIGNFQVMSNHLHLVSRTRPDIAATWSDEEVAWRWKMVWPKFEGGQWVRSPTDEEIEELLRQPDKVAAARQHLASISWLMARWKEPFSRERNREDTSRGTCWEARFGCREVLEGGLLALNVYLDLNQLQAGMADSLGQSQHSGIRLRLRSSWEEAEASWLALQKHGWGAEDGVSLELLGRLFADCWLAPIGSEGPLKLVRDVGPQLIAAPSSSGLILPHSNALEHDPEKASNVADAAPAEAGACREASRAAAEVPLGADCLHAESGAAPQQHTETSGPAGGEPRRPGTTRQRRSGRPLSYAIHGRYQGRQRPRASDNTILDISRERYIELVEWAAAELYEKRGAPMPEALADEMRRLGIVPEKWFATLKSMDRLFNNAVGPPQALEDHLKRKGRKSLHGIRAWRAGFT